MAAQAMTRMVRAVTIIDNVAIKTCPPPYAHFLIMPPGAPVHESRVTSVQDRGEPRASDEGASVDHTERLAAPGYSLRTRSRSASLPVGSRPDCREMRRRRRRPSRQIDWPRRNRDHAGASCDPAPSARLLPQVQPDEAGPLLLHELRPLLVKLLDSLLLPSSAPCRPSPLASFQTSCCTLLRPLVEPLLELRLAEPVGGGESAAPCRRPGCRASRRR